LCWITEIQRSYANSFRSVWEYEEAILEEKIDWKSVIGPVCPICGEACGYRRIADYYRTVKDLVSGRSGPVPVARFQCLGMEGSKPTFSMLPYQLVPYFQHTLESMVRALELWRSYWKAPESSGSAYRAAEIIDESLRGASGVTSWQLRTWALVFQSWLRRVQAELADEYDFSGVAFFEELPLVLDELHGYFGSLCRGPPGEGMGVLVCVKRHAEQRGGFVLGVPSQGR
jgi:hypothetical protein